MAGATKGTSFGLNCQQVLAAQMLAHGLGEKSVMHDILHITESSTPIEKRKATHTLHKWMALPGFAECYQNEVRRTMFSSYGRALSKVDEQIDSDLPWLANKAANDILSRGSAAIMGEDDKKIVVQVEGAPMLGTPDQDE